MSRLLQTFVGLGFAIAILAAWAMAHVYCVFFYPLEGSTLAPVPLFVLFIMWVDVGLFIIAHDCMHNSLAPGRPAINRIIGRSCLFLYPGFSYDRLKRKHFDHHRWSGTELDPDFDAANPQRFLRWYGTFMRRYFGFRELIVLSAVVGAYLLSGASMANILTFWACPALLSSVQLFLFGTYLPHRHGEIAFPDAHRARSSRFNGLVSLLTCYHFGYHHEHHRRPDLPWWKLPAERARPPAAR